MNLKEIEYFLAIAQERSLSRAAEKLFVSQPALSKFLIKLEDSMGTQLFIRRSNMLCLTKAGQVYLDGAKAIYDISRSVNKQIEDIRDDRQRTLTIGVTGERTQRFLGKMLLNLYRAYPDLRVHVLEHPVWELSRKLKDSELDLALYAIASEDKELTSMIFSEEEVILAISKQHRLAPFGNPDAYGELKRIGLKELEYDAFVLLKKGTAMRQIADAYFQQEGVYPHEVIETKGTYSSMVFVDSGLAVGFCPRNYNYPSDQIRYLGIKNPFFYPVALLYKSGTYLTKPMKQIISLVYENRNIF